jgi:hypothetical protein
MIRRAIACLIVTFMTSAACVIAAVDLSGKSCPCPGGWVCTSSNVCELADATSQRDGTQAHDTGPFEASHDATTDAGHEGSPRDAGSLDGSWCHRMAPDAFFCCDFDDGSIGCEWTPKGTADAPNVTVDPNDASSPPFSLLAASPTPLFDGQVFNAYVSQDWPDSTATALHFAYDLSIAPVTPGNVWGTTSEINLVSPPQAGGASRSLLLLVYSDHLTLQERIYTDAGGRTTGGGGQTDALPLSPGWQRINLDVSLDPNAACTVTIAGQPVAGLTAVPLEAGWSPGYPQVDIGITYAKGAQSAPWVKIDNVTLYIK